MIRQRARTTCRRRHERGRRRFRRGNDARFVRNIIRGDHRAARQHCDFVVPSVLRSLGALRERGRYGRSPPRLRYRRRTRLGVRWTRRRSDGSVHEHSSLRSRHSGRTRRAGPRFTRVAHSSSVTDPRPERHHSASRSGASRGLQSYLQRFNLALEPKPRKLRLFGSGSAVWLVEILPRQRKTRRGPCLLSVSPRASSPRASRAGLPHGRCLFVQVPGLS